MVAIISVASWERAVALARLWLVRGCVHLHHPAWQRWLTLGACARSVHLCPGARFSMARRGRGEESEWPQKGSAPLTLCHIVIRKSPRTRAQTKPVGSSTVLHSLSVVLLCCTLCTKFTVTKLNTKRYILFPHPTARELGGVTWNRGVCCSSEGVSTAYRFFRDQLSSTALGSVAVMKPPVAADLTGRGGEGGRTATRIAETDGRSRATGLRTAHITYRESGREESP